jgi:hypothetical protein
MKTNAELLVAAIRAIPDKQLREHIRRRKALDAQGLYFVPTWADGEASPSD